MLYLMTVLTFLAGIMFYLLSPRDDQLHLDVYQAEPLIQDLISQHQAAKDYVRRWFGVHKDGALGNHFNLVATGDYSFEDFSALKENLMCENNFGDNPGFNGCFLSRVVCVQNDGSAVACNSADLKEMYVVTYGGWEREGGDLKRPGWWPNANATRTRRNERWRRAIAQRTHGSLNCGTLYEVDGQWCIDNGQVTQQTRFRQDNVRCVKPIPAGVIAGLTVPGGNAEEQSGYLFDMFFCMSPIKQGPASYYPSGLVNYFDGLDNWNRHAPTSSGDSTHQSGTNDKFWYDLVEPVSGDPNSPNAGVAGNYSTDTGTFSPMATFSNETPYLSLATTKTLGFNIAPGVNDFTISVVAALSSTTTSQKTINNARAQLIYFKGAETDGYFPTLSVDVIGTGANKATIELNIDGNGGYKFKTEDIILNAEQPFTLTMVRQGDRLNLYLGGHETYAAQEKRLFSGRLSEVAQNVLNAAFREKMAIQNPGTMGAASALNLYAVRYFNRDLGSDEVYHLYKEDVNRYGAALATHFMTEFNGNISWDAGAPKEDTR